MIKTHVGHVIRSVLKIELLALLIAGCNSDATTSATITIPIDTVTVIQVDFVSVHSRDTLLVTDTIIIRDTIIEIDTVLIQSKHDSVVFPLEGYIGDATMASLDLGTFQMPERAQVWVQIELSGNKQKDEVWGLRQLASGQAIDIVSLDCPLVPDYPWVGTGWVFVGYVDPGTFSLEARHASLYDCYDPVDYFRTANSVHFRQVKFVWLDTGS